MINTKSSDNTGLGDNAGTGLTLADLADAVRWVAWQTEDRKIAYGAGQRRASSTGPGTWLDHAGAVAMSRTLPVERRRGPHGLGVMLGSLGAEHGGLVLCGLDLDSCMGADGLAGWAADLLDALGACYVEVSPSGTGLKAFLLMRPEDIEGIRAVWHIDPYCNGRKLVRKQKNTTAGVDDGGKGHPPAVEFYYAKRWFAVTGSLAEMAGAKLGRMTVDVNLAVVKAMGRHGFNPSHEAYSSVRGSGKEWLSADELAATDDPLGADDLALWEREAGNPDSRLGKVLQAFEDNPLADRSACALSISNAMRALGVPRDAIFKMLRLHGVRDWFEGKAREANGRELARLWNKTAAHDPTVKAGRLGAVVLPVSDGDSQERKSVGAAAVVALRYDATTIRRLLDAAAPEEAVQLFTSLFSVANLNAIEVEEFVTSVSKKSGTRKGAIRERLKEIRRGRVPAVADDDDWQKQIQLSDRGEPLGNLANATLYLRFAPELIGIVKYDLMMRSVCLNHRVPGSVLGPAGGPQQDNDISEIQEWMQRNGLTSIGREVVQQAVNLVAQEHAFHPVQDYLNGLKWDREKRLDTWLKVYLGAGKSQSDTYLEKIGRLFILSMVYRIMNPGCQCDYMLVLEGAQGLLKTTACNALADIWFSNSLPDLHGDDAVRLAMHLRGKWLIEIGELSSFRKSDVENLKNFLSKRVEEYTPKFFRNEVKEPRQCVFIGTTNEETYLKDATGGRRFWPVKAEEIKIDLLRADRDELFAEAMEAYRNNEQYWPDRNFERDHIKPQQDERRVVDTWEEIIQAWLECPGKDLSTGKPLPPVGECTTKEVAECAVGIVVSRQDTMSQKRISGIMSLLGWVNKGKIRIWKRKEG